MSCWKVLRSCAVSSTFTVCPSEAGNANVIGSPIPGAVEKIASLRQRHRRLAGSLQHYEVKVAEQTSQLSRMNRSRDYGSDYDGEEVVEEEPVPMSEFTEEDMRLEEDEILELERKKRSLEERVTAMEKDINGVMR